MTTPTNASLRETSYYANSYYANSYYANSYYANSYYANSYCVNSFATLPPIASMQPHAAYDSVLAYAASRSISNSRFNCSVIHQRIM